MEKTELRIVAGSLRGRKITVFVHEEMRPTPQMVREALFSILGNAVPGRIFYDIFSGTGIVGIEAVSRGASSARLIERDSKQAAAIQKEIDRFEIADKAQVLRADAYRWAERWIPTEGVPVNLFLSPPFADLQPEKIGEFIKQVKDKNSGVKLMGFGHRVYKNFDPRAKVMKESCDEVLELLGVHNNPTLQVAKELERIALQDDYFISKKLYPNVDFYSGIILEAIGFPTSMFTPIFALSRTVGWISQWREMIADPTLKIAHFA